MVDINLGGCYSTQYRDLTWSHGFEYHLYIIDSQMLSPTHTWFLLSCLISPTLPTPLLTRLTITSEILCSYGLLFCTLESSPFSVNGTTLKTASQAKTSGSILDDCFSLYSKSNSSANHIGSNFKLYPKSNHFS